MSIKPRNDIPIWQTYILITNPLYVDVKDYTLIYSGFIHNTKTPHSGPIVYARKKMGLLGSVKIPAR